MRLGLKVYYDGRAFYGSQVQPDKRTVEGELLKALGKLGIEVKNFQGAARTDRGVSALGNVYAFDAERKPLPRALNSVLPSDLRALAVMEAPAEFNPRRDALEKVYKYFLYDRGYDLEEIRRAAKLFEGEHSFHNFCKLEKGRNPVRCLKKIEVAEHGGVIVLTFLGQSFLWQMVRRLVTALRGAGEGRVSLEELRECLQGSCKRKFPPSPPEQLMLWSVRYDFEFRDEGYSRNRLKREILRVLEESRLRAAMMEEAYREL
jgi:tRNA pseudouridine38-40 synthase